MNINWKKNLLVTTILCGAVMSVAQPALAVDEAEFAALKAQMQMFAGKLEQLEGEQKVLKSENATLKAENTKLQQKNASLEQNLNVTIEKTAKIEQMSEAQIATRVASVEPAAGEAHKDGVLIPGTDTRIKFGGYVKADAIHDFNVSRTGNGEDFGLYSAIPLKNSIEEEKGGNTRLHARQTRLNVTTTTPTDYGDLKVVVEGDFFSDAGSQTTTNADRFGIRHAYGEMGGFLLGQTWSNFMDLDAYPESLDYQGVSGNTLLRQGQIRYTYKPEGSKNSFSVAVENPSTDFLSGATTTGINSSIDKVPDVTANAKFVGDFGEVSFKGVARHLEAYNSALNASDSDFGYAIGASGKINTWGKDDFRFQVAYGDGIGRYIYDLATTTQAAGYNGNTDTIETVEAWGGYAAYRHWWTDSVRSNFIAGTTQVIDNPSFLNPATTNESIYSLHGNLIWSINSKVDVGAEYIYGHRETESGAEGELHRSQVSATYKF